jgi:hypothetical protein
MKMTRIFRRPRQKKGAARPGRADNGLFHGASILYGKSFI